MKIATKTIQFLTVIAITLISINGFASETEKKHNDQNDGGRVNTKEEVEEY
ncbi:MAG: ATP synthase F0 subunit A, partial [Flavobacteriaceae bacterium]|nr:ATP synthase F0 subunit A [Flavobacteriaceae bacterium]